MSIITQIRNTFNISSSSLSPEILIPFKADFFVMFPVYQAIDVNT